MVKDKRNEKQSNAEKPLSLKPLEFDEAVSDLLKVEPEPKEESGKGRKAESKRES